MTPILSTSDKHLITYNYFLIQEVVHLMLKPEGCPNVWQEEGKIRDKTL